MLTFHTIEYLTAYCILIPSCIDPMQNIKYILASGLFKAEENAIADSPIGKSLQSLYFPSP
nr:MAG TPA: hypothetical protein [Caudoviricetes sp.]